MESGEMDTRDKTEELEEEIRLLREELERARIDKEDLEKSRRAALYLMEDLDASRKALSRGKREWEVTFDAILNPICIHDRDLKIVRANRAYQHAAGERFNDFIGHPFYQIFPLMEMEEALRSGDAHSEGRFEVIVPDSGKNYTVNRFPIHDDSGEYIYSVLVIRDVTEEKRVADRERVLNSFHRGVMENLDLDTRFTAICETVANLGFRMAWIGSLDENTSEVVPEAWAGEEKGYLRSIKVRYDDSPHGQGPSGRAVRTRSPQVQNMIRHDQAYEPWREAALKRGYGSSAAFPVMDGEKVRAVLNVYHADDIFPQKEVEFLYSFACQAGVYIRNARLYEDLLQSDERLRDEMKITSNLLLVAEATAGNIEIDRLMEKVVEACCKILNSNISLSYLYDKEWKLFRPAKSIGLERTMIPVFMTEPISSAIPFVRKALEERRPVMIMGLSADEAGQIPDDFKWLLGKDLAVIPLIGRSEGLGLILSVWDRTGSDDSDGEVPSGVVRLMEGISHQVSTALEEARQYKESIDTAIDLSYRIETIQVMHEIDKSILSTLEPQEILDIAAKMVARVIRCDSVSIYLIEKEKGGFVLSSGYKFRLTSDHRQVPFIETSMTEVAQTLRPKYVPDMGHAGELFIHEGHLLRDGYQSYMRVPLVVKGEVAGILCLCSKRASSFMPDDLATLERLSLQVGVALANARLLKDIDDMLMDTIKSLTSVIDAKSPWTAGHSERVTKYAVSIGKEMGLSEKEIRRLQLTGLLHDIGKIGTYEVILDKPGILIEEEIKIIRLHPVKGAEILSPIKQLKDVIPGIRHHHEFYDGTGYPEGLKGEAIPFFARILTVADSVDAMGADRPYRKGRGMDEILKELKKCSGSQFDPAVVDAFLKLSLNKKKRHRILMRS